LLFATLLTDAGDHDVLALNQTPILNRRRWGQGVKRLPVEIDNLMTPVTDQVMVEAVVRFVAGRAFRGLDPMNHAGLLQQRQSTVDGIYGDGGDALAHPLKNGFHRRVVGGGQQLPVDFQALMGNFQPLFPATIFKIGKPRMHSQTPHPGKFAYFLVLETITIITRLPVPACQSKKLPPAKPGAVLKGIRSNQRSFSLPQINFGVILATGSGR